MFTLLFATDLHGSKSAWTQLFDCAQALSFDAIALGGDLLPLPLGQGSRPLQVQTQFADGWLHAQLCAFKAAVPQTRLFTILGNDDWLACEPLFEGFEREGLLQHIHQRAVPLFGDRYVAGYSCVPITPFGMSDFDRPDFPGWKPPVAPKAVLLSNPQELYYSTLAELEARPSIACELEALALLSSPQKTIYVTHSPPFDTACDRMTGNISIGSRALRQFIETHRPVATLHGHIHESPRLTGQTHCHLGTTLVANPGDSKRELRALCLSWEDVKEPPRCFRIELDNSGHFKPISGA